MVISAREEVWRRTFSQSFSSMNCSLLCLRYVDNRLWISEDRIASLPGVRLFLSNHFYGGNIALEDEPAVDFVGFSLDIPARTIRYNRSCHIKDLPSPLSASSQSTLVSGLLALAHTIRQCAYPASQVHSDLCCLWSLASERKLPVHNTAFFQKFWNVRRSNKQPKSTLRCSVLSCSTMQAPVLFVVPREQTGSSHQFLRSYC